MEKQFWEGHETILYRGYRFVRIVNRWQIYPEDEDDITKLIDWFYPLDECYLWVNVHGAV